MNFKIPVHKPYKDNDYRVSEIRIICQQCFGDNEGGCSTCGGYGFIAEKVEACSFCMRKTYMRPGNHTIYVGKQFRTMDGMLLEVINIEDQTKFICSVCKKEKTGVTTT